MPFILCFRAFFLNLNFSIFITVLLLSIKYQSVFVFYNFPDPRLSSRKITLWYVARSPVVNLLKTLNFNSKQSLFRAKFYTIYAYQPLCVKCLTLRYVLCTKYLAQPLFCAKTLSKMRRERRIFISPTFLQPKITSFFPFLDNTPSKPAKSPF